MAAGSIVVDLLLKTGSFETDTARASNALKKMQKDAEKIGTALGFSLTAAATGFALMIRSAINAEDHLNDLSKKTGIAADTLGGIGFAAQQSGGDLDTASAAAGKLNKSLAEAAAGNVDAAQAFNVLGISVKDAAGNTKKADVVLAELADKFATYADGPEKAALALKLFGKAGADIIPLLDEGGKKLQDNIAYYQRFSGVTNETVAKADAFNDTLTQLNLLSSAFGKTLAAELLPTLQALADAFVHAKESGDGFTSIAGTIGDVFKGIVIGGAYVIDTFGGVGREIGAIAAQLAALAHLDFKGFSAIGDAVKADGERAKKELDAFVNNVLNPTLSGQKSGAVPGAKSPAPRLPNLAGRDNAQQLLKKELEGQIKTILEFGKQQDQAFSYANAALDGTYAQGNLSLQKFFDEQNQLRDAQTQKQLERIDQEIAIERKLASGSAGDAAAVEAREKIKQLQIERSSLILKNAQDTVLAEQRAEEAIKRTQDSYENLRATILSLQGNDSGADAIRNAQQTRDAAILIRQAGGDPKLAAELGRQLGLRTELNKATKDYGNTLADLGEAEARVALAVQTGAITSLGALVRLGEERRKAIPVLEAEVAAQEAIAKASGNDDAIRKAAGLRLELDKLKASADPLAASLNQAFGSDLEQSLTDFVTGTKSATEAFHSFTNAVLNDILKLGSKSIAESIFGGSGGVGGLLSDLFKGSGGNVQGIGDKYNGSGGGGAGLVGGLASLFAGAFADGGYIPPGQVAVVGERGPELAYGGTSGKTISPMGGTTQNITLYVTATPGMSRDTAMQQGAAYGAGIQKALARNS